MLDLKIKEYTIKEKNKWDDLLEELIEFKEKRLVDIVEFYGVYHEDKMIAGSMVFNFQMNVFHTQYLAADQQYLNLYPMNFLNTNLSE